MSQTIEPKKRSNFRLRIGKLYYGSLRKMYWIRMKDLFADNFQEETLVFSSFSHKTILLRKLKDVDMWLQHNKIVNLRIASKQINGIIIRPGEIFSYWKLIGNPTKSKGYIDGMVLKNGTFHWETGGGLCQLSNLIFWMTIHTPLTVIERHRHGFDVFPDSNRTQPFGSGATCFYPHGDLMIQNNTTDTYQLIINVGDEFLQGEWRLDSKPQYKFEILEKNHEMKGEYWGGYSRHNELWQQKFDLEGNLLDEELIIKNSAIMMYSPFLEDVSK